MALKTALEGDEACRQERHSAPVGHLREFAHPLRAGPQSGTHLPGGHRRSGADHPRQTPGHTDGPRVTQGFPPHETVPNAVNYTIEGMRRDMEDVHRRLLSLGDRNLIYVDGLEVFDLELIERYTEDQCHPDGDGIEVQADRFDRAVMDRLLPP